MCLLDEDLEKSGVASMIQRLTSALASCAQLSQLSADKRTWALQVNYFLKYFVVCTMRGEDCWYINLE